MTGRAQQRRVERAERNLDLARAAHERRPDYATRCALEKAEKLYVKAVSREPVIRTWRTGLLTLVLALALVGPAQAEAPYLGIGEAKSALGRQLHRSFEPGVRTGSMLAFCGHHGRRDVVRCDVLLTGWDGYAWCGGARVRKTRAHYYSRWDLGQRHCELF